MNSGSCTIFMCDFCGVYCLCGVYDVNISGVVVVVEDV